MLLQPEVLIGKVTRAVWACWRSFGSDWMHEQMRVCWMTDLEKGMEGFKDVLHG